MDTHLNSQDSRLRRQPLWWLRHCFPPLKFQHKMAYSLGQMIAVAARDDNAKRALNY